MAGHSKWANIKHRKGVQGETELCSPHPWGSPLRASRSGASVASLRCPILLPAELSRMHLTCIRAAERPTMGEAVVSRTFSERSCRRTGMPWMACPEPASGAGSVAPLGRAGVTRSISCCARDGMHDPRLCGERQISEAGSA